MILSNPCATLHDGIEYPVTPIMKNWHKKKIPLRVVQEFQNCYIVGDGKVTQLVNKDMVTKEIDYVLPVQY